jgi:hypothetical protein
MPAFKPYWGKPTVRNFREGDGNVGIIRSPVRAIILPDRDPHPFPPLAGEGISRKVAKSAKGNGDLDVAFDNGRRG